MPDGRGARIALEAGFLVAVAAVLAAARLEPVWIVLVMLLAWVIVALLEWAAWREEPHWASGQPPRYYVPFQAVPPRPATRELPPFSLYPQPPEQRDDAPTWIATPELREELLGWPAPPPIDDRPAPVAGPAAEEPPDEHGWAGGWPVVEEQPAEADPWSVEELPGVAESEPAPALAVIEREPDPVEPEPVEPEPVAVEPEVELEPGPEPEPVGVGAAQQLTPRTLRLARHRLDPFAEEATRRWPWQRRGEDAPADAELPSLPQHARILVREPNGAGR